MWQVIEALRLNTKLNTSTSTFYIIMSNIQNYRLAKSINLRLFIVPVLFQFITSFISEWKHQFLLLSNLSTMANLGTKESDHCGQGAVMGRKGCNMLVLVLPCKYVNLLLFIYNKKLHGIYLVRVIFFLLCFLLAIK